MRKTKTCTSPGCTITTTTTDLCNGHHKRKIRGDLSTAPIAARRHGMAGIDRVREQSVSTSAGCIVFTGCKTTGGYGQLTVNGKRLLAHRVALTATAGPPPPDKPHALHSCDNPSCVNPDHLRWGSNDDNVEDMIRRQRVLLGEACPVTKLTVEQVVAIRADSRSCRSIGGEYGVSAAQVSRIKRRERWTWLPEEDEAIGLLLKKKGG